MSDSDSIPPFTTVRNPATNRMEGVWVPSAGMRPPPGTEEVTGLRGKREEEDAITLQTILHDTYTQTGTPHVRQGHDMHRLYEETLDAWKRLLERQALPESTAVTKIEPETWPSMVHEIVLDDLRHAIWWIVKGTGDLRKMDGRLRGLEAEYSAVVDLHTSARPVILASLWSALTEQFATVDSAIDMSDKTLEFLQGLRDDGAEVEDIDKQDVEVTALWASEKAMYKNRLARYLPDTVDKFVTTFLYDHDHKTRTSESAEAWGDLMEDLHHAARLRLDFSSADLHTARAHLLELSRSLKGSEYDQEIASDIKALAKTDKALMTALTTDWAVLASDARARALIAEMDSMSIDRKSTKSGSRKKKGKGKSSGGSASSTSTRKSSMLTVFVHLNPAVERAVQAAMKQPTFFRPLVGPEGQIAGEGQRDMVPSGQPGSGDGRRHRGH